MTKFKRTFLATFFVLSALFSMPSLAASLKVIANASVEDNQLKLKDLRSIYTMKKSLWSNGDRIVVFVLSNGSATHKEFCRTLLKVFPRQLESIWYRLVFSGTGERPVSVSSEEEMRGLVAATPGAIGYIRLEDLHEETKIITVK
jgi:ABC-type phosphate transport system substrate-binding protein